MNRLFISMLMLAAAGCSFSPKKQAPLMNLPANFKESGGWKVAQPADHLPRGNWWAIFHDSELDAIMQSLEVSNQSLQSAVARAQQTSSLLTAAKLAFLPTATATSGYTVNKSGSLGGSANTNSINARSAGGGVTKIQSVGSSASWELDLWGRLRHTARATKADAEAVMADVESTRLTLQTQAAQSYFSLRAADAQKLLLERQVASYAKSLQLTENRKAQGVASEADVALAATQLATSRVALIETGVVRATMEHALAVLTGRAPADFGVKPATLTSHIPALPATAPSALLQRRPDIAAGERRVAAANERIGAAIAAFFPTVSLGAATGWRALANLFAQSSNFWSFGPDASLALLDSGQRLAAKAQADATWRQAVADYRQAVLTAMQETEDALSTLRILAAETEAQNEAVRAARESERITSNQYEAGTLSYINVITAQATALNAERSAIDLRSRRLNATVALIKALGGGW
ncbi:MAG: efflux transporter outer membrane subunit [Prosthecobacter sp.]|uniref:efflux transporter outer membrane subunit n=1 Tax=Prosthecobacter sp. TaxID=1965333 RepID=UPI0025FC2965|nr:efflux transporter outer membrane subunit [Prosthecobacter sp.]MCF7785924.1 efflux transporter outer membrane subunit [Prosthecobacter sp.]